MGCGDIKFRGLKIGGLEVQMYKFRGIKKKNSETHVELLSSHTAQSTHLNKIKNIHSQIADTVTMRMKQLNIFYLNVLD